MEGIFLIDFELKSLKNRGLLASTAQSMGLVRYYDIAIGYVIVPIFRYRGVSDFKGLVRAHARVPSKYAFKKLCHK